jgi:hypothetical protein
MAANAFEDTPLLQNRKCIQCAWNAVSMRMYRWSHVDSSALYGIHKNNQWRRVFAGDGALLQAVRAEIRKPIAWR